MTDENAHRGYLVESYQSSDRKTTCHNNEPKPHLSDHRVNRRSNYPDDHPDNHSNDHAIARSRRKLLISWGWGIFLVVFFVVMIFVYSIIVLGYAWEFSRQHTISGYLMCCGIIIIPIIGGYLVFQVIRSGINHQRLAILAEHNGYTVDVSAISRTPSGRLVRSETDALFAQIKTYWEEDPQSWGRNYQLARAYDFAGDRPRAREFMRRAIALEKAERLAQRNL